MEREGRCLASGEVSFPSHPRFRDMADLVSTDRISLTSKLGTKFLSSPLSEPLAFPLPESYSGPTRMRTPSGSSISSRSVSTIPVILSRALLMRMATGILHRSIQEHWPTMGPAARERVLDQIVSISASLFTIRLVDGPKYGSIQYDEQKNHWISGPVLEETMWQM